MAALWTGAKAVVAPIAFSKEFGIQLETTRDRSGPLEDLEDPPDPKLVAAWDRARHAASSYTSLMGVRQLATGNILLTFAFQSKLTEMATILLIIGFLVAGTDSVFLSRAGSRTQGLWHAIPGVGIAVHAGLFLLNR